VGNDCSRCLVCLFPSIMSIRIWKCATKQPRMLPTPGQPERLVVGRTQETSAQFEDQIPAHRQYPRWRPPSQSTSFTGSWDDGRAKYGDWIEICVSIPYCTSCSCEPFPVRIQAEPGSQEQVHGGTGRERARHDPTEWMRTRTPSSMSGQGIGNFWSFFRSRGPTPEKIEKDKRLGWRVNCPTVT
jgi:hypothetical protein